MQPMTRLYYVTGLVKASNKPPEPTLAVSRSAQKPKKLEDLITEPLSGNGLLRSASLAALFLLFGAMSHNMHIICLYDILTAVSSGSTISAFWSSWEYTDSNVS
jgi:hypothetical protein